MAKNSENTELLISNLKEENQQLKKDNEQLCDILLNYHLGAESRNISLDIQ